MVFLPNRAEPGAGVPASPLDGQGTAACAEPFRGMARASPCPGMPKAPPTLLLSLMIPPHSAARLATDAAGNVLRKFLEPHPPGRALTLIRAACSWPRASRTLHPTRAILCHEILLTAMAIISMPR